MTVWAVFVGRRPGIYDSWNEAKQQVNGFPKNSHKAYRRREEAEKDFEAFCNGLPLPSRGKTYVVFVGRRPGIYNSWHEAKQQVDGYPNCCHRAYRCREEALKAFEDFVSANYVEGEECNSSTSGNRSFEDEHAEVDIHLDIQLKISNLRI